jgi:hypothetical protein
MVTDVSADPAVLASCQRWHFKTLGPDWSDRTDEPALPDGGCLAQTTKVEP